MKTNRKLKRTPITDAELARSGFFIIENEFKLMSLTITKFSDGYYNGIQKLESMYDISKLVYGY